MKNIIKKLNDQLLRIGIISEPREPLVIFDSSCAFWEQPGVLDAAIKAYQEDHPPATGQTPVYELGCTSDGEPAILQSGQGYHCQGKTCEYYKASPGDPGEPWHLPSAAEQQAAIMT